MKTAILPLEIPDYMKLVVDSQILKTKSLQKENTMSFIFFTDPHISDTSSLHDIAALNYVNNNLATEFTACCGDNLDNVSSKQSHLEAAAKFIKSINVERFFTVKGNHDDNSIQSEGIDNIRYTMLPEEQYDIMFRKLEKKVSFDPLNKYGLYYYCDIPKNKIRAIFLNSIDIPYINSEMTPSAWKYSGQSTYAYSNSQLNWLAHIALKLPSDEWKVIFFTHVNPFREGMIGADKLAHNSSVLLGIIDAFKNGANYTSISSNGDFAHSVSADFSFQGAGKIVAFFYGHTHSEQVLCRDGIKYISSWNDCPRKSASNPDAPMRTIGTVSEICLNVVTIDFKQDKIFITKFGAGDDIEIDIN
jgi:Calcineurin-like phosphoesterase.